MYDRNNWAQVWLAMPGVAPQSSTLFWFETISSTGTFPFGTQLATDAADYFSRTLGWTCNGYNGSEYLHAYLSTTDFGPPLTVHGYAAFPGMPPATVWAPALSWVWIRPFKLGKPTWRNVGFSFPISKATAVARDVLPGVQARLDTIQLAWQAGWRSQGRLFIPVSVSYLRPDWTTYSKLVATGFPVGRSHRQRLRRTRIIGNVPKLLP